MTHCKTCGNQHREHDGCFSPSRDIAFWLALLYHVRTEENDRSYPHVLVRGAAMVYPEHRAASLREARNERRVLDRAAECAGVAAESVRRASARVSGYGFEEQQELLAKIPDDVRELDARVRRQLFTSSAREQPKDKTTC